MTDAVNGDYYYDTDEYILYKLENNEWVIVIEDFGKPGQSGEQGQPGESGASWISGTTVPDNEIGNVGDFYVNTETWDVYNKGESSWNLVGNIKGEQGNPGQDGEQGSAGQDGATWLSGVTAPSNEVGKNGDFYIDTNTWNIYKKLDNSWTQVGNIKGEVGQDGQDGQDGVDGEDGKDGATWFTGTGTPDGSLGKDNDFYLNTSNYDLYKKSSSTWTKVGNIKGQAGQDGQDGVDGEDGVDGATWLSGVTKPSNETGKNGDFYIDTTTWDVYKKSDGSWIQAGNIKGEIGQTGQDGQDGQDGEDGEDGATWFTGTGAPSGSLGKDNDLYLDTSNYNLYKKSNSTWSIIGNIKGETGQDGEQGSAGQDGATWSSGNTEPNNINGKDGDFYLNTSTWDVYKKADNSWIKIGNIKGDTGDKGEQGQPGQDGEDGKDGVIWTTGETTPSNTEGKDGDFYLNTLTWDVYLKTNGNWNLIGNIKGEQGETGDKGDQGNAGADGATILTGTGAPSTELGKNNDVYLDTSTWDIYQKTDSAWQKIGNIKGEQGDTGAQGPAGENVYVGYDGYIWQGTERTDYKLENVVVDTSVAENTLSLYENTYFSKNVVDTTNPIGLLSNYFEILNKTGYSGTTIDQISFYAQSAGKLEIGTASVEEIISSRREGTQLTVDKIQSYDVVEGLNVISLNLKVDDNETIVLGGGTSNVKIYYSEKVDGLDDYGFYTISDGSSHGNLFEDTQDIENKLIIKVNVKSTITEYALYEDIRGEGGTKLHYAPDVAPFAYQDYKLFEGKTISRIDLYVESVDSIDDYQYFTIYKVPSKGLDKNMSDSYELNILETYKVTIPIAMLKEDNPDSNINLNKWFSIDLTDYNIRVEKGETLAFGSTSGDPVKWCYAQYNIINSTRFIQINNTSGIYYDYENSLLFNLYYSEEENFKTHLEALKEEEESEKIYLALKGKNLSILGDSISTFQGVSNNDDIREGLGQNAVYYTNQFLQGDTYWQQIIDKFQMNLCVNNSWSGAYVTQHKPNVNGEADLDGTISSGMARADELDTNDGTKPDYIFVFIGINDWNAKVPSETFKTAYYTMINTITTTYPDAKVFCLNMPNRNEDFKPVAYNNAIEEVVNSYEDVYLVDVYNSEFNEDVYSENSIGDNLHPNAYGMDYLTNIIIDCLKEVLI